MKAWRKNAQGLAAKAKCLEIIDKYKDSLLEQKIKRIAKRCSWVTALGACQRSGIK